MYYNNFNNNNNGFKRRPKEFDYDGYFQERDPQQEYEERMRKIVARENDPTNVFLRNCLTELYEEDAISDSMLEQQVNEIIAYNKRALHSNLYKTVTGFFNINEDFGFDAREALLIAIGEFQRVHVIPHFTEKDRKSGVDIEGRIGSKTLAALVEKKGLNLSAINAEYLENNLSKEILEKIKQDQKLYDEVLLSPVGEKTLTSLEAGMPIFSKDKENETNIQDTISHTGDIDINTAKQEALEEKESLPVESIDKSALSGGEPLQDSERAFFETQMNADGTRIHTDFSDVRVHTDKAANESAESINADAYTVGTDIVFGEDKYQPGTKDGSMLMAHELGHVGQQKVSGKAVVQRQAVDEEWKRLPRSYKGSFYSYLHSQYKHLTGGRWIVKYADAAWIKLAKLNNMTTDVFRKHVEARDKDLILTISGNNLKTDEGKNSEQLPAFNPNKIESKKERQPDGSFKVTLFDKNGNMRTEYVEYDSLRKIEKNQATIFTQMVAQAGPILNADNVRRFTYHLTQWPGKGLDQEIKIIIKELGNSNLNISTIRNNACVAASLYILLKLNGADIGSFSDYYIKNVKDRNIRARDAFVALSTVQEILKNYPINNKIKILERVENWNEFKNLLEKGETEFGMLRLSYGHTINIYKDGDEYYVSDVGNPNNHGKKVKDITGRNGEYFSNFEYLK